MYTTQRNIPTGKELQQAEHGKYFGMYLHKHGKNIYLPTLMLIKIIS